MKKGVKIILALILAAITLTSAQRKEDEVFHFLIKKT